MSTTILDPKAIDGKKISDSIIDQVKQDTEQLKKDTGVIPGLAVVLVGQRTDSQTYVRMKKLAAEKAGFQFLLKEVNAEVTQDQLLEVVQELNRSPAVHGLIVQLPLPSHIHEQVILDAVSYEKDIDGFHPLNIGALCMKDRDPLFVPCTPKGCLALLDAIGYSLEGKHVVVLGRSNIVGLPVSMLCLHKNATVTICHSRTTDLPAVVKQADVLIAAVGRAQMVKKEWVKEGAIVIDVGMNSIPDASRKSGSRLVGDVDYEDVKQVAARITPVPGGVGPMTVAMLLTNTLNAAKRAAKS
jgi:5,10-methylene-tetrahydrofolate dehydrogenase/methenyl tetrahydrofolate cyclohydrolase